MLWVLRSALCALQFSANINAWITTLGFAWLVGPMELQESEIEFQGETQKWKSKVLIKKCRYLEASGCVGMCTNMCQVRAAHSQP